MIDVKYAELDVQIVVDLKYSQEYHKHVECTPIMDQRVNEVPQQTGDETHTSYPSPFPWLSSARRRNPRRIHVDESSSAGLEGKWSDHSQVHDEDNSSIVWIEYYYGGRMLIIRNNLNQSLLLHYCYILQ